MPWFKYKLLGITIWPKLHFMHGKINFKIQWWSWWIKSRQKKKKNPMSDKNPLTILRLQVQGIYMIPKHLFIVKSTRLSKCSSNSVRLFFVVIVFIVDKYPSHDWLHNQLYWLYKLLVQISSQQTHSNSEMEVARYNKPKAHTVIATSHNMQVFLW